MTSCSQFLIARHAIGDLIFHRAAEQRAGAVGFSGFQPLGLESGHLQKVTSRNFRPEAEGAASHRDDTDRSQARSAWKSVPRKNRPVRYDRARLIPEVFLGEMCAVFLKEG
jgi:hypothetical protein